MVEKTYVVLRKDKNSALSGKEFKTQNAALKFAFMESFKGAPFPHVYVRAVQGIVKDDLSLFGYTYYAGYGVEFIYPFGSKDSGKKYRLDKNGKITEVRVDRYYENKEYARANLR